MLHCYRFVSLWPHIRSYICGKCSRDIIWARLKILFARVIIWYHDAFAWHNMPRLIQSEYTCICDIEDACTNRFTNHLCGHVQFRVHTDRENPRKIDEHNLRQVLFASCILTMSLEMGMLFARILTN